MKRALVIYSPSAGKIKSGQAAGIVRKKLKDLGCQADWFVLDDSFEEKIRGYDFSKIQMAVAMGGDGTVNAAGSLILKKNLKIPLAVIPAGSANVIAQELKLPFKIAEAAKLLAKPERFALLDAGIINDRHYFFVGFSLGYVSEVVTKTAVGLKKKFGFLGYLFSLVFGKIRLKTVEFGIKTRNQSFNLEGNSLVVFNAVNYRGLKPRRKIFLDDGVFSLFVFTSKTLWVLLTSFVFSLSHRQPPVKTFALDDDYFKITLEEPLDSAQIDGDYLKLPRIIEIKIKPRILKVIVR